MGVDTLKISTAVRRSELYAANEVLRHQLLWLNGMQLWLAPYERQLELLAQAGAKTRVSELDPRMSRLLARYVRANVYRFKPPRF
ncbi:hypothetical protein LC612_39710 [Nostoc sp. CHAB 5834]|nr:hypothetical protein [Nostoc sp. CHAB 5834]